jgi:hypothetical protein
LRTIMIFNFKNWHDMTLTLDTDTIDTDTSTLGIMWKK